jgi:hypothetical protein
LLKFNFTVPEENNCFIIITQVNIRKTEKKVRIYWLQVKKSKGKCSSSSYIHHAVNIAKYNEILNQSARVKLYIHLWIYNNNNHRYFACADLYPFWQWFYIVINISLTYIKINLIGGWTRIKKLVFATSSPGSVTERLGYSSISNLNRFEIISQRDLLKLKQDMGFTQIRYFCRKASVGRVFHVMTAKSALGLDAVR